MKKFLAMLLLVAILASCTLALAATKVKTTGKVCLRENPRLSGKYIRSVKKGTSLKIKAEKADKRGVVWYKVKYKGKVGWISSKITNKYKKVKQSSGETKKEETKEKPKEEPSSDLPEVS